MTQPLAAPGGIPVPADRWYHSEHLWVQSHPEKPGIYRIGLSAYACRWGIEVYFIDNIPAAGSRVDAGGEIGSIETEKRVMPLHAPFAGTIAGINERVLDDPSIITFDNYGQGWIAELGDAMADAGAAKQASVPAGLWSAAEYVEFLQTLPPPQCGSTSGT